MTRGNGALVWAVAVSALFGCTAQKADVASEVAGFVAPEIPEAAHRRYIDFGGKLALVAYELVPDGKAGPGQNVTVKFYWRPISSVSPGWGLFTHLEDGLGRQARNFDEAGPFRKWLTSKGQNGLSLLEQGRVYLDEQSFDMPQASDLTPEMLLVVGVWNGDMRLSVVSGPTNGHQAGIVARIDTGLEWPKVAAKRSEKEVRR